ncbi:MAG: glycosyltransferase family A protein [Candidatus Margulisbacteria bacterium]|nr:glycosyltransferase family A protein [Candidatus Margulisiibacteriota bacterium]
MLVSVIIPTYDRPEFTREAVESVLAQSFQDFEIIVVDDGSGSDHQNIRVSEDQRVRVFQRQHRGAAAARNFGVSVSAGKYIAFLDSDDLWEKKKLEKQLEYLRRGPEYKICYTGERWLRGGEHLNQMKKHQKYHGWIFDKCLPLCIISASSILMERQMLDELGGFDESLPVCEDYDLWLRLSLRYPIAFIDEQLIVKRGGHPDQLSRQYWGMDRFRVRALQKLLSLKLSTGQKELVRQELMKKYNILASGALKRKRFLLWLYYQFKQKC